MVESVEDGEGDVGARLARRRNGADRKGLVQALVGARPIEVRRILDEDGEQMPLAEHQNVIDALAPHASEKALAYGIGLRGAHGGSMPKRKAIAIGGTTETKN
jgi:hypothetical protein